VLPVRRARDTSGLHRKWLQQLMFQNRVMGRTVFPGRPERASV